MKYLTKSEYINLGYDEIDNFDLLVKKAENTIDLYIDNFYVIHDFESDIGIRKNTVKSAVACQVHYLNESGILTADEKVNFSDISIGRTSIKYGGTNTILSKFNMSIDAENLLKSVGFGYKGVAYDR